jgi:hypothetical protein
MQYEETAFDEPITQDEVLCIAESSDPEEWSAYFGDLFAGKTLDERCNLIRNPVELGLAIFSVPGKPLRYASEGVRDLLGSIVTEKLLLRLPAFA